MTKNWIWAGGFLALAFGGIAFGAKAGVDSGRAALRLETARIEADAVHDAEHGAPNAATALAAARSVRARPDVEVKKADPAAPVLRAREVPKRLEARAVKAPVKVDEAPRPKVIGGARPLGTAARLFTPASELDIAFATGRIDRLEPRREAKVEVTDVDADDRPTDRVGDAAKSEVEVTREAAEETLDPPLEDAEAPVAEAAPAEPPNAVVPVVAAPEAATDDVDVDEAAPTPVVEATEPAPSELSEAGAPAAPEAEFEDWPDETDGDLYPYASRVEVSAFGRSPARI